LKRKIKNLGEKRIFLQKRKNLLKFKTPSFKKRRRGGGKI
jgi:hypothetical protein